MKAIILAAGYGTRLKPITNHTPKCLVKINNIPLLEIWLNALNKCGVNSFLINTHHLSELVKSFVNNSKFKKNITLVHENKLLGTAGTLKKNLDFLSDNSNFFLHADNLCKEDLRNLVSAHNLRPKNCLFTMMSFKTKNPKNCGILQVSKNIMVDYNEKPSIPKSNLANCATYILTKKFIADYKESKFFKDSIDFSKDVVPNYINKVYTYQTKKLFVDIGTIKNYHKYKKTFFHNS